MALLRRRALNRATLDRQLLLRRASMPMLEAVEHLVGLQAQTPHTWYHGLWCRLAEFDPRRLADLLIERKVVRMALMRSTIHLVTARDCLLLRPLVQPVIERSMNGNFGKNLSGVDAEKLIAAGRELLEERPLIFSELGRSLARQWPDRDPASLAQAVRAWVPLVQVPPRGVWGASGRPAHTTVESWLGRGLAPESSVDDMVLRYLAAFGPAGVRDAQTWSGLTRLGEVFDRLRPGLVTFADEHGRELFDLPDAPRPDPDVPAPPRFLYDFDNLLLSHADRSRVITERALRQEYPPNVQPCMLLVDGFTNGDWKITRHRGTATLTVRPFNRLSTADIAAVTREGARLLEFAAPGDTPDIRFVTPSAAARDT
ncbi:MAG TPA: winged helix DNA-binding domain-containing protein [Actinophytocola sp.]|uniref:winged helix DNA-binding domain-containing protein n=1 Tax=Actinophytocola sp. TaxID=1872138 RepID=UPI002DDD1A27|nr:winged helix DNA-binding domain-containing protein [Actinophytocola sp.]HEV2784088.1 winged helix DNA-binding domain-containing protein [Actinophytocola sp.]